MLLKATVEPDSGASAPLDDSSATATRAADTCSMPAKAVPSLLAKATFAENVAAVVSAVVEQVKLPQNQRSPDDTFQVAAPDIAEAVLGAIPGIVTILTQQENGGYKVRGSG